MKRYKKIRVLLHLIISENRTLFEFPLPNIIDNILRDREAKRFYKMLSSEKELLPGEGGFSFYFIIINSETQKLLT